MSEGGRISKPTPIRIGRYELLRTASVRTPELGPVWIARDGALHRRVWLIPSTRDELSESARRALGQSSRVTDPSVLSVLDFLVMRGDDPDASRLRAKGLPLPGGLLVLEHVVARTFDAWLRSDDATESGVHTVMRDVAIGLDAADRLGVHHGELTPRHVLVGHDAHAHLWLFEPERRVLTSTPIPQGTAQADVAALAQLAARVHDVRPDLAPRQLKWVADFATSASSDLPSIAEVVARLEGSGAGMSASALRVHPDDTDDSEPLSRVEIEATARIEQPIVPAPFDPLQSANLSAAEQAQDEDRALALLKMRLFGEDDEGPASHDDPTTAAPEDQDPSSPSPSEIASPEDIPSNPPPSTRSVMEVFGRYTLVRRLGEGGVGTVYLALDAEVERKVAIKIVAVAPDDPEAGAEIRRLRREARALARIRHPNVVQVYDVGSYRDEPELGLLPNRGAYLVIEYVPGQSLYEWARRRRPWPEVLSAYVQCARGLAAAHAKGVVHRDFKPSNVLLGKDGVARVLDFGLAVGEPTAMVQSQLTMPFAEESSSMWVERLTGVGMVVGTPAYMAPEQYLGAAADELTDQFSLCVALFEHLYGVLPFAGSRARELRENIIAGRIDWPDDTGDVPRVLKKILARGMSREPADRYPTMQALREELEGVLGRTSLRKKARPKWPWLAAAAAFGTVAATGIALLAARPSSACADAFDTAQLRQSLASFEADSVVGKQLWARVRAFEDDRDQSCARRESRRSEIEVCLAEHYAEVEALIEHVRETAPAGRSHRLQLVARSLWPDGLCGLGFSFAAMGDAPRQLGQARVTALFDADAVGPVVPPSPERELMTHWLSFERALRFEDERHARRQIEAVLGGSRSTRPMLANTAALQLAQLGGDAVATREDARLWISFAEEREAATSPQQKIARDVLRAHFDALDGHTRRAIAEFLELLAREEWTVLRPDLLNTTLFDLAPLLAPDRHATFLARAADLLDAEDPTLIWLRLSLGDAAMRADDPDTAAQRYAEAANETAREHLDGARADAARAWALAGLARSLRAGGELPLIAPMQSPTSLCEEVERLDLEVARMRDTLPASSFAAVARGRAACGLQDATTWTAAARQRLADVYAGEHPAYDGL